MMQTVSDDPLVLAVHGVVYSGKTRPEGYELYRDYGDFQVYRAISTRRRLLRDEPGSETEYKSLLIRRTGNTGTAAVIPDRNAEKTTWRQSVKEKSTESVDNFRGTLQIQIQKKWFL